MTELVKVLLAFAPCVACAVGATLLAVNGDGNFGWFIFGAVCLFPNYRTGKVAELHAEKELVEAKAKAGGKPH